MSTLEDIAKAAGVSVSTVSRILSGSSHAKRYRQDTHEKVMRASQQLGYKPNLPARALAGGRTQILGVVFPRYYESAFKALFMLQVVTDIEEFCSQHGYHVLISSPKITDNTVDESYISLMHTGYLDGVIVDGSFQFPGIVETAIDLGLPTVVLGRHAYPYTVDSDNEGGGYIAMAHLLQLGHRRIGILSIPQGVHVAADQRIAGMEAAAREADITFDTLPRVNGTFSKESGALATRDLLTRFPETTAIITVSDRIAIGAIQEAQRMGYTVPDDLSVVGHNDLIQAAEFSPALTTVSQSIERWGPLAVDMLFRLLNGEHPEAVLLPCELKVRASTAQLRTR
jgi:LacI family transcriptional regulator